MLQYILRIIEHLPLHTDLNDMMFAKKKTTVHKRSKLSFQNLSEKYDFPEMTHYNKTCFLFEFSQDINVKLVERIARNEIRDKKIEFNYKSMKNKTLRGQ